MSEIKIKVAEEIIRRCLNDLGAIIRHIPEGRDGEKFERDRNIIEIDLVKKK